MAEEYRSPISGLTNNEAKELHRGFMTTMTMYIIIALIAHYLVWAWRPWFPGTSGYKSTSEVITSTLSMLC
jgi:light-harvesting complex 1 beta chain